MLASYSEMKDLKNEISQGSTLSPILFVIMINDLPNCLDYLVALMLFISYWNKHNRTTKIYNKKLNSNL